MPAGGGRASIAGMTAIPLSHSPLFRPAGAGAVFVGPGDLYRFLVTGAESGGAYFAMEAYVPPGGGPPPHIHRNEDVLHRRGRDRVPARRRARHRRRRRLRQRAARRRAPLPHHAEVAARYAAAAPRYGLEFIG
jgi:hypothetical protein